MTGQISHTRANDQTRFEVYQEIQGCITRNRVTEPFGLKIAVNFFRPIPFVRLIAVVIPLSRVIGGIGINAAILALVYGHHQFEPVVPWTATILIVVFVDIVHKLGRASPAR